MEYLTMARMGMADSDRWSAFGFPYGSEVTGHDGKDRLNVAVVHDYVWTASMGYPGAPVEKSVAGRKNELTGYDVAVFGDNHRGFERKSGKCLIYNCGCPIRRRIDEMRYDPSVGLLYEDGSVVRRPLKSTKDDRWLDVSEEKEAEMQRREDEAGLRRFVEELGDLGADSLDFRAELDRVLRGGSVEEAVKDLLREMLG